MNEIYFDNNATTPIAPEVSAAMQPFLTAEFGNPSSAHAGGRAARRAIEAAREETAEFLGASAADEIIFTSGGTESDNWAILGALRAAPEKKHIVTTRVEHEAVRLLCEKLAAENFVVTWLEVDESGALDLAQLKDSLRDETAVVSIMTANNETGILFPVNEIAEIVKANSAALFHTDAVNAAGKIAFDLKNTAIDLFSFSGHKFHAPKGVGGLYVRRGVRLPSMLTGGGQENGRRAGTEAVHQIAGLGAAAKLAKNLSPMIQIERLRDRLENEILNKIPNSRLNGTADGNRRLPNTTNISFENTNGEAILAKLDAARIYVSTGSACNEENHRASPVLQAMKVPYAAAMGALRFSLGRYNTTAEIERVFAILPPIVAELRALSE